MFKKIAETQKVITSALEKDFYSFANFSFLAESSPVEEIERINSAFANLPDDQYVESKDIFRKRTFGRFACLPSESIVDRPYEPYVERANNFVGSNRKRFFPEIDMVVRETLFLRNAIGLICKAYRALTDSIATLEIGVHMISITANDQCNGGLPA